MVFNPSQTTPDATGTIWDVRTGDKGMYFFAAASFLNDDYLITPVIDLSGAIGSNVSFWAKSLTADFGLERFEVLLSTTGNSVSDFTINLSGGEIQAPVDVYTEYSYDISDYDGQQVFIAIHYMGQDSFVFQTDDFKVEASTLSISDNEINGFNYFYSPQTQNLTIKANESFSNINIFNVLGQQMVNEILSSTDEEINLSLLNSGVYIANVISSGQTTFKFVKR